MKVKIFDENHEKDLEQDINDFLSETNKEIVSLTDRFFIPLC